MLDAGLRPRPFPDDTASLLPGPLTATRTGLTPASDDKLTNQPSTTHMINHQPSQLDTQEVNRDADLHRPRSNGDPTCHSSHPERLRRMRGTRHPVGASSAVPDVRARRLLRLVADATRQEPRPHHRASHHAIHGARRILALVLCPRELRLSFAVAAAVLSEREVLR